MEDTADGKVASFLVQLDSLNGEELQRGAKTAASLFGGRREVKSAIHGRFVFESLRAHSEKTQKSVLEALQSRDLKVHSIQPYWVSNTIVVEGGRDVVDHLSNHPDVRAIRSNRPFRVKLTAEEGEEMSDRRPSVEWNIQYVKADKIWEKYNFTGEGFVLANADTGVQWDHPALKARYVGLSANGDVDHHYGWWDGVKKALSPGEGKCGINGKQPCDDNGHGTHTTSTSVGNEGVGVAPGAQFMSCRNMDRGLGSPETYISCLQFFVAPTDMDGSNPNPEKRPHAIGNSYGCPKSEGCDHDALHDAVQAVRAAGIFMAVSAGNDGPGCSSITAPPATEQDVFSVAALGQNSDSIAYFSSRGPIKVDGSNRMKPEISAPGSNVRGAFPTNQYKSLSGTSMASPHLGGAVMLVSGICPSLERDVDGLEKLFKETARPLKTSEGCGGDSKDAVPNNTFGYGSLDLEAAIAKCVAAEQEIAMVSRLA